MMVLRKLAVALLSAGVMLPGLGHALAVKELQTKSALGEPFRGEVELIELGDLNANEIKVALASQDDFARMGVDRAYFLNDLRFDVEVNPGGRSVIRISSSKPVVEPYLDFVVRIAWPGNARLQEVTALLDPPLIADSAAAAVDAPQVRPTAPVSAPTPVAKAPAVETQAAPAPVLTQPRPVPAPAPRQAPAPVAPRPAPVAAPDSYRVQAGDTAARLAERFRGGASSSQAMIALQRANPSAFANKNINLLKRGQVLRIPSEAQMREVNAQEAVASVREQNAQWQASLTKAAPKPALEAAQVDATAKAPSAAPVPVPASKPQMKLLGTQAGGTAGTATAGKEQPAAASAADERKLSQVKSQADAAKAEKDKLAGKVQTLDAKVKANDQKVSVQNARVAQLETQLKETQAKAEAAKVAAAKAELAKAEAAKAEAAKAAAAKVEAAKVEAAKVAAAKIEAAKVEAAKVEAAKVAAAKAEADAAAAQADKAPAAEPAADAAPVTSAQAEADAAAPAAPAVAAPAETAPVSTPAVVAEEAPAEEASSLPLIGGGVAALLAVLGGGWWWNRRRREQEEAEATLAELESLDADVEPDVGGGSDAAAAPAASLDELDDSWLGSGEGAVAPATAAADRVLADPLEEAEQYIAYERYPQAVGLLSKAINASPDRADLRMKLLEVYAHLDDWDGFCEQEAWFEQAADLDALARAEELKAGLTPPADAQLDDGTIDFVAPTKATEDEAPSLEDLEMDFNANVGGSSPALTAVQDDALDLDDFAGFDAAPAASEEVAVSAESLDDLSFELDHDAFADAAPAAEETLDGALDTATADESLDFALDTPASDESLDVALDTATADEGLDFALDTPAADEGLDFALDTPAAGGSEGGLGDLVDLDAELAFEPVALESTPAPAAEDDLSFSLDDLEVSAEQVTMDEVSLDDDFSLAASDLAVDDLSLESGADAAGELADGEFVLDDSAADANLDDLAADFDATLQFDESAPAVTPAPVAAAAPASADGDLSMDDEFDFLADTDENATKLDLARAYIDMGDMEGARDILQEVMSEGSATQKDEAKGLLAQVG